MKYLENFNSYDKEPILDSVDRWIEFLDNRYPIYDFRDMKTIEIEGKTRFLSGSLLTKKRLTDQIFYDIKTSDEMQGSKIHEPSLRKAIKDWINKYSKLNESSESFDKDFAIAKIKEQFPSDKVKQMLDKEVLEWIPEDKDSSYYPNHSSGEAEDTIITHLIDWYSIKYPSSYSEESEEASSNYPALKQAIQKEYNFLNY